MNKILIPGKTWRVLPSALLLSASLTCGNAYAAPTLPAENTTETTQDIRIVDILPLNPTTVEIIFSNQQRLTLDFYGNNIFRLFQDPKGGILRDPVASPEAQILVDQPRKSVSPLQIEREAGHVSVGTDRIRVTFDKTTTLMSVKDLQTSRTVLKEAAPAAFDKKQVTMTLKEQPQEYFYGGGVQNGRFSHKGKTIAIENQNSWTDGGVASPNPFYWSTKGYGVAFRYLVKPVPWDDFVITMDAAVDELTANRFSFELNGKLHSLPLQSIYFIESFAHIAVIHTADEEYRIRATLSELKQTLPMSRFATPHKSYLVNMAYINSVAAEDIILTNGVRVPISRRRKQDFNKDFCRFLGR